MIIEQIDNIKLDSEKLKKLTEEHRKNREELCDKILGNKNGM